MVSFNSTESNELDIVMSILSVTSIVGPLSPVDVLEFESTQSEMF